MKIRLLGTGAAEGIPAFCADTYVSNYAREHGGKDLRTRCGAIIDDCLKIDLPPDTLAQMHRDRVDARAWTALFFTHSDDDHFSPAEIQYALYPFNNRESLNFTIFANGAICAALRTRYPQWPMEIVEVRSFCPIEYQGYLISPIRARHKPEEDALNFIFEKDGRSLLYATDTGLWEEATWEYLKGFQLDLMILECTEGVVPTDYEGHLGVTDFMNVLERLRGQGTLKQDTIISTTHHSHNGGATHADLEQLFSPKSILVGYDGLELTI